MARAQAPNEIPVVDVTAEKKKLKEERKKLKAESRAEKRGESPCKGNFQTGIGIG